MSLEGAIANIGKVYRTWASTVSWNARGLVDGREVHISLKIAVYPNSRIGQGAHVFVHAGGGCDMKTFITFVQDEDWGHDRTFADTFREARAYFNALVDRHGLTKTDTCVFFNTDENPKYKRTWVYSPPTRKIQS